MIASSYPTQFTRRVSFNNLDPEGVDFVSTYDNEQCGGGASSSNFFKPNYSLSSKSPYDDKNNMPMDLGYGSALFNDVSQVFSLNPTKKKLKLPDPPSRSILKNKLSPQYIASETLDYHEDLEESQREKELQEAAEAEAKAKAAASGPRRKSYSDMTFDELMALDPQFQKPKTSDMNQFKFDSQKTYYLPARRSLLSAAISAAAAASKLEYPSSNENNYKCISLTVQRKDFDHLNEHTRTLLSVISGRRHTWNSIDWLFQINQEANPSSSFLQDGDCLVLAAIMPIKYVREYAKKHKKANIKDHLYKKCEHLLNYLITGPLCSQNTGLRLKVTVEFVTDMDQGPLGGNKHMLQHLFRQYQPNLVVVGNKLGNLNFKYPIRIRRQNQHDEYLIKLSLYIIKYLTVPVILVGNATSFHNRTGVDARHGSQGWSIDFEQPHRPSAITFSTDSASQSPRREVVLGAGDSRSRSSSPRNIRKETAPDLKTDSDKSASLMQVLSHSSSALIESVELYTVQQIVPDEADLQISLSQCRESDAELRFADMVKLISDKSLGDLKNYLTALQSKDDSLRVDSKIHAIYRLQTSGGASGTTSMLGNGGGSRGNSISRRASTDSGNSMYKVRSLVSYNEDLEGNNDKMRMQHKKKRTLSALLVKLLGKLILRKSSVDGDKKKSFWQKLGLKK